KPKRARTSGWPPTPVTRPPSRNEGRARDGGRVLRVPLGVGKSLVDLLERIFVRDEPVEGPAGPVADEEVERSRNHAGVVLDHAHDLLRAPDQQGRLELDLGATADRADLEIGAARAEHFDPFRDNLRESHEVAADARARATRPLANEVDALAAVGDLFDVERVVGAEGARQLEPPR